jgi:uncharacterized membrane protein
MIKKYLLTGLVILLPSALTLIVIIFLFNFFTTPLVNVIKPLIMIVEERSGFILPEWTLPFFARVFSLIFLAVFIFLLGVITQLFLVKTVIGWMNLLINKIPFIKTVYQVSVDIFSALFSLEGKKAFKYPVMIPFPSLPNYAIGFVSGEIAKEIQEKMKEPLVPVFSPTAPHPISGFLFLIPEKDVKKIDMNNEAIVKFLFSCGTVLPETEVKDFDDYF